MNTQSEKNKICFIMQSATPGTHMDYVFEMARTLREENELPLTLLLEKGGPATGDWIVKQRYHTGILRVVENVFLILSERRRGTKVFYIHYSFLSAITAGIVTTLFGGTVYYWNAGMPWQYKRPWYTELYQKIAYRLIDTLVTGADALRDGYVKTYGLKQENIVVIPNWINLAETKPATDIPSLRQRLGLPVGVPLLLFVHKLAKRKGAHLLVPIIKKVQEQNTHLVVAGDGPEMDAIKKAAQDAGLSERVHLLGKVPRDVVAEFYQASDIFIMPSHEEGSPHSLIEAMAYGLPTVSFSVGGVAETLPPESASYCYPYGAVDSFAVGIDALLSDKEEYRKQKQYGEVWVQRFKKELIVEKFYEILTR